MLREYIAFKAALGGFGEVKFLEFREKIVPLRKKAWTDADAAYARELGERGADFALRQFCGSGHEPSAKVLGKAPAGPPMTRAELDTRMDLFVRNSVASGWTREMYLEMIAYYDSDATLGQLAGGATGASAKRAAEGDDDFAKVYRTASPAYRQVVRDRLNKAARSAAR